METKPKRTKSYRINAPLAARLKAIADSKIPPVTPTYLGESYITSGVEKAEAKAKGAKHERA